MKDIIPANAQRLIRDASEMGYTVEVTATARDVLVRIVVDAEHGETICAGWTATSEGWRKTFGSDGWTERMSLRQIRSFL